MRVSDRLLFLSGIVLLLICGGYDEATALPDTTPPAHSVTASVSLERADGNLVFRAANPHHETTGVQISIEPPSDNAIYEAVVVSAVKDSDVKNGQIRLGAEVVINASIRNIENLPASVRRVRFTSLITVTLAPAIPKSDL